MTKVSIILPVFNAERFLAVAVASLLVQSHRDIEVIAIDDGSTDGSKGILDAAADLDPRVTVLSRPNQGLIATLNQGLELADTDFVARMDADDISYPDRIAAQLAAFAQDDTLGLLGTNFDTLLTEGRIEPAEAPRLTGRGERAIFGRFVTPLRHPSVMFRRTRLGSARLAYDAGYPCAEDFELFRRLADETRVAETALPHLAYRLHAGSVSNRQMAEMIRSHVRIFSESMQQHYPQIDLGGFEAIGTQVSPGPVAATAAVVRQLDRIASEQPPAEREAFAAGVATTFYFFYAHICRSGQYALALRFARDAGRWASLRRRERLLLKAAPSLPVSPAFALFDRGIQWRRKFVSRPVTQVVPNFARIEELARRIERVAQTRTLHRKAA